MVTIKRDGVNSKFTSHESIKCSKKIIIYSKSWNNHIGLLGGICETKSKMKKCAHNEYLLTLMLYNFGDTSKLTKF